MDQATGEEPFCFNPLEIYGTRSSQRVVQEPTPAQVNRMANCIYAMILSTRKSGEIVSAEERNLISRGIQCCLCAGSQKGRARRLHEQAASPF